MRLRAGWCAQTIIPSDTVISQKRLQERCKPWVSREGVFTSRLFTKKGAIQ